MRPNLNNNHGGNNANGNVRHILTMNAIIPTFVNIAASLEIFSDEDGALLVCCAATADEDEEDKTRFDGVEAVGDAQNDLT